MLLEKLADSLAGAGLKRLNVSLDTLRPGRYQRISRFGAFDRVWSGILAAEQAGLSPIKLNAVIMRGVNDDELLDLARLSIDHAWHIRFIEWMPIGSLQDWGEGFPVSNQRYLSVRKCTRLADLALEPAGRQLASPG
jgi:cyclic pyranopterin phosphate synthase